MAKTLIKKPFGKWTIYQNLYRASGDHCVRVYMNGSVTVTVPDEYRGESGAKTVRKSELLTNLSEAIAWADKYIEDNYEVEKDLRTELENAKARITVLEAEVETLKDDGYKFAIGQKTRHEAESIYSCPSLIHDRRKGPLGNEYNRYADIWYPESKLRAAD